MKVKGFKAIACMLALALAVGIAGAQQNIAQTYELGQMTEAQAIGGYSCASAWGFTIGLGLATLSGCSIVCATAAWYSLALLSVC
jgi:hypothetical protein